METLSVIAFGVLGLLIARYVVVSLMARARWIAGDPLGNDLPYFTSEIDTTDDLEIEFDDIEPVEFDGDGRSRSATRQWWAPLMEPAPILPQPQRMPMGISMRDESSRALEWTIWRRSILNRILDWFTERSATRDALIRHLRQDADALRRDNGRLLAQLTSLRQTVRMARPDGWSGIFGPMPW